MRNPYSTWEQILSERAADGRAQEIEEQNNMTENQKPKDPDAGDLNPYEERQEARRERYEELAEKAAVDAQDLWQRSSDMLKVIPLGQPILVGHHSEKGHRALLKRADRAMRRGLEADAKSKYYQDRARAVGKGGISSDDPDAIDKLQEKLTALQAERDRDKAINAYYRKHKTLEGCDLLSETAAERLTVNIRRLGYKAPLPAYHFRNAGANIRRIEARIKDLETRANEPAEAGEIRTGTATDGTGYKVETHPEDEGGRIWFIFDAKPAEKVRESMKRYGWKYSPTRSAYVRFLNNAGRAAAEYTNP